MLSRQMRVAHRRLQIRVTQGLLHLHNVFALSEPRCNTAMPQVVKVPIQGELRSVRRGPHCHSQTPDTIALMVMPPASLVVKHPLTPPAQTVSSEVLSHGCHEN